MSSSWMPPPGRCPVNIGSSLGRAIKSRKLKGSPAPTAKRSNLPDRDFYSFKFNFKPSSIDTTKPASIDTKKGAEQTQVLAEYPSTTAGQAHHFTGTEMVAKDVDCILIYDEDTGQYTLEKIDSFLTLKYERSKAFSPRTVESPPAATPASSSSSAKGKAKQEDYGMDLDDQDADGEADGDMEEVIPSIEYHEEEEPEEGEEIEIPLRVATAPSKVPPKVPRGVNSVPKARAPPQPAAPQPPPPKAQPRPPSPVAAPPVKKASPPPPKAKPQPKPKKAKPVAAAPQAPPTATYPDEEVIEFGRPTKRARPSPPPPRQPPPAPVAAAPVSLSLPGGSSSFAPPPPPPSARAPPTAPAMPPSPQMIQSDSEDDEDQWEPVQTVNDTAVDTNAAREAVYDALEEDIFGDNFADEGDEGSEEIDMNTFEQELNEQLDEEGSDDDFVAAALSPEPERGPPISLNRLASGEGAPATYSDDEYSSSDDSDDD